MSNADELRVSYVEEITFGATPNTTLTDVRLLSESLKQDTGSARSAEIDAGRQTTKIIRTSVSASGGIAIELSYGTYDDFLEAALQSAAWSSAITEVAGNSSDLASNVLTVTGATFITDGVVANQWIRMTGWPDAENNTYAKILSVDSETAMTLVGPTLTDDTGETGVEVEVGEQIVNGTTFKSFSIERHYTDLSNEYAIFTGMSIDQFSLNIQAEQIITGGFEFLGKDEASGTASAGSGYTLAPTNDSMNAVEDVEAIFEGAGAGLSSLALIQFAFTQVNNLRQRPEIAKLGPDSLGSGKHAVTGTFQGYYATATLFNKYLNFGDTALAFAVEDAQGNAYVIDFPQAKLTGGQRVGGGENTDIIADMTFEASRHSVELITTRIVRWAV